MNKYNAVKVLLKDGRIFDSKAEYARYLELELLQQAGEISDLMCQPKYTLIEAFTDNQGKGERAVIYTADFCYIENGATIVEEVKSAMTRKVRDYSIRRKLFKLRYPHIIFREVE